MNVKIEQLTEDDIELVRKWRNSDLIANVSFSSAFISPEQQRRWYFDFKNDTTQLAWIIFYKEVKIGFASIKDINKITGTFIFSSLYIGEEIYINSGVGAIAEFLILNYMFSGNAMQKATCEVLHTNMKVIQLHKKFGFQIISNFEIQKQNGDMIKVANLELTRNSWMKRQLALSRILIK
jgi:UDP-4-amino-4,6-dideoxy-N-acetyl-beta-L-altrosamine N-acetyltransferase